MCYLRVENCDSIMIAEERNPNWDSVNTLNRLANAAVEFDLFPEDGGQTNQRCQEGYHENVHHGVFENNPLPSLPLCS